MLMPENGAVLLHLCLSFTREQCRSLQNPVLGGELWKPVARVIVAVSVVITPSPCEHRDLLKMQKQNLSFSCDNVVVAKKEKLKLLKLA